MSKKKETGFKVEITDELYYEALIWMSYRYCIGRKTIASHSHAGDIAQNISCLSPNRQKFMAHDIRREINSHLSCTRTMNICDYRNHIPQDGLSTIFYRILEKYGPTPPDWVWTDLKFDIDGDDIKIDKYEGERTTLWDTSVRGMYDDLLVWVKLANYLDPDCHRTVVAEHDGKTEEFVCFPYPYMTRIYDPEEEAKLKEEGVEYYPKTVIDKRWCVVEDYPQKSYIDSYINPECIKEIR